MVIRAMCGWSPKRIYVRVICDDLIHSHQANQEPDTGFLSVMCSVLQK